MQTVPLDIYRDTLLWLDPATVINFCSTNKYATKACNDQFFFDYINFNYNPKIYGLSAWDNSVFLNTRINNDGSVKSWLGLLKKLMNIKIVPIHFYMGNKNGYFRYTKGEEFLPATEIAIYPEDKVDTIFDDIVKLLGDYVYKMEEDDSLNVTFVIPQSENYEPYKFEYRLTDDLTFKQIYTDVDGTIGSTELEEPESGILYDDIEYIDVVLL